MTALPFQFPILTFSPDPARDGAPEREFLDYFVDSEGFATCESWKLKFRDGMTVADSNGLCWTITDVQNLGSIGSFWMRAVRVLLRCSLYRVSCGVSAAAPLSLHGLKDRVCSAIDGNPEQWWDDEALAGEAGPPRDEQEMLDELKTEVRRARSVAEIIKALWPSSLPFGRAPS
jgi:hypothetical protein